ncbi:autorepressor SdpR family transcription factor [Colwelliaceae bacterium 6441]
MGDVFQALSSPVRREILSLLKDNDLTAGELAAQLNITKSTLSGHFNVLKAADLVATQRQATTITYSLKTSVVEDLIGSVMTMFGVDKKGEKL